MTLQTNNNNLNITKLAYEKINDRYYKAKYGEFDVIMDMTTGYINATKLCTDGGRKMCKWFENKNSQELIVFFNMNMNGNPLYEVRDGIKCNNINGTYVHPDLILVIACWISPIVFLKINNIINEWRKMSPDNEIRFHKDIGDAIKEGVGMFENNNSESVIRDKIALEEKGQIEVKTEAGFIDVLTDTKIIEVKKYHHWKHALGQVECYGYFYPNKQKWIYLFDTPEYTGNTISTELINEICKSKDVFVKYILE
jgi:hypothetical protein